MLKGLLDFYIRGVIKQSFDLEHSVSIQAEDHEEKLFHGDRIMFENYYKCLRDNLLGHKYYAWRIKINNKPFYFKSIHIKL